MASESRTGIPGSGVRAEHAAGIAPQADMTASQSSVGPGYRHSDYSLALSEADRAALLGYIRQVGLADLRPRPPSMSPAHAARLQRPLPRRPKAVLVDVYGTLLASGLGELGATEEAQPGFGGKAAGAYRFPEDFTRRLHALIAEDHEKARAAGLAWPEIDAVSVFMRLLNLNPAQAARACVEWECLANPCAPMPGAAGFLKRCGQERLPLGLVSNAQFYTGLFIQAAFGEDVDALGFDPRLSFWSYQEGRAKPERFMYDQAARALAALGIDPGEALYVGNDALNDCAAAGEAGFMTALFAGDERSFRPRETSTRAAAFPPDTVIPGWDALAALIFQAGVLQ